VPLTVGRRCAILAAVPATPVEVLDLIEARRRDDVTALVREVRDAEGLDAAVALLVEVQREVGERWRSQRWTVADEHGASAIVDHALTAVCDALDPPGTGQPVVVACVEDEWHVLPARMVSEQLRCRGWRTTFLGASSPAGELGRTAGGVAPVAVALSCSMPIHLPGARRSIEACHGIGVPVAVGGGAFGGPERAAAVGADRWCATVEELHATLEEWARRRPELATPTVPAPEPLPSSDRRRVLDAALRTTLDRIPPFAAGPLHVRERLRDDLDQLLRSAEAAVHVADPRIAADQLAWQAGVSGARGEPDGLAGVLVAALAGALPEDSALRRQLAVEV